MRSARAALLLVFAALLPRPSSAQDVSIAAASDLQAVLPEVAARFERETGLRIGQTFGSSGTFFSQIQNGAPFDLFFSADIEYAARLQSAGLAEPGSLFRYATGRIVLWTRRDSGIDVKRGLPVVEDPRVRRIAIANPDHAPYGRAAVAALQHEGLYDRARSKFVLGENISQAAQFVQSGNAEVGIIALSLARSRPLLASGSYVEIAPSLHPPIEQAAVILRGSRRPAAARQFLAFLSRPEISLLMQQFGFSVPGR